MTNSFSFCVAALLCIICLNFPSSVASVASGPEAALADDVQVELTIPQAKRIQNGIQLVTAERAGAGLQTSELNVRVQFRADDIVRVVKWLADGTPEKKALVVI